MELWKYTWSGEEQVDTLLAIQICQIIPTGSDP